MGGLVVFLLFRVKFRFYDRIPTFMLTFKKKLIQGPLAGYSCAPFRVLAEHWGKPDFCCSEMLSAQHIYQTKIQLKRYHYKSPEEGKLCVQLAGDEPIVVAFAANKAQTWGADLIDLNCGCPKPKIRKKYFGSRLLEDTEKLYHIVSAIKKNVRIPVLVKIRVDNQSDDHFNQDVAQAIESAGADAITVHGRHWTDDYSVPVSYKDIAEIKKSVNIPVIANGDIKDTESARNMFSETGCDALMISRAGVGQPWIFEKIYQELQGNVFTPPNLVEIGEIFLAHIRGLMALGNEKTALYESRKLGKYYARNRFNHTAYMDEISKVCTYDDLEKIVSTYFKSI